MEPQQSPSTRAIEPVRALTAVRGLAAWWVVAFHFREALPPGTPAFLRRLADRGYLAVDLFFILSGYVIALNYGRWFAGAAFSWHRYARFLGLRLSRIYPLHLVMLLLFPAIPLAAMLFSHQQAAAPLRPAYYALSFLLMQNWGLLDGLAWNVPAWSISTEWFAYLAFPLLVIGGFRLSGSRPRALLCIAALLAALALAAALCSSAGLGYTGQRFGLFRCVAEFSAGIGIFRLDGGQPRGAAERGCALALAALCFAVFAMTALADYLIMPLGFAALVHGLSDERGTAARLLRAAPLQWLGVVSYSTYLSHYFLKAWTKFILVRPGVPGAIPFPAYIVAVLLVSAVLYRVVERPGQRWLRRHFLDAKAAVG